MIQEFYLSLTSLKLANENSASPDGTQEARIAQNVKKPQKRLDSLSPLVDKQQQKKA